VALGDPCEIPIEGGQRGDGRDQPGLVEGGLGTVPASRRVLGK
jgi:hypothetical protein